MSEPTQFTADDLALLDAAERDYHAEMQERTARRVWEQHEAARVRAAVEGVGAYSSMPIAPPVEVAVEKPVKHATVKWVGGWILVFLVSWALAVIVPVGLIVGVVALHQAWCVLGLLVYMCAIGTAVLGLHIYAMEKAKPQPRAHSALYVTAWTLLRAVRLLIPWRRS